MFLTKKNPFPAEKILDIYQNKGTEIFPKLHHPG